MLRRIERLGDRLLASVLPQTEAAAINCWEVFCACLCGGDGCGTRQSRRCCKYADGHTSCAGCRHVGWC